MMLSRFHFVLAASLVLTACQSLSPLTIPDVEAESKARIAVQSGDFNSAAQQYEALAESSGGIHRARLYIEAASAYWQVGDIEQTRLSLAKVDREQINFAMGFDISVLEAKIAIQEVNPSHALDLLSPYDANQLTARQQRSLFKTRLQAYQETSNWLEQAKQHIALDRLLPETERETNQRKLWQALMQMAPDALDLFNPGLPPAVDSGWFALAYIIKAYKDKPDVLIVALDDWERSYPNHPAMADIYKADITTGTLIPQDIKHVAILLPETGPFASAAEAIKRGIFAAHYADNGQMELHVIPVETDRTLGISSVEYAYQQAINLGAELVIGPLDKIAIDILAKQSVLPVPVLALNRSLQSQQKANLYQFGLSPEHDATSAAEYAWSQGYRRAVIVAPEAEWAQRIAATFGNTWVEKGGVILGQNSYNEADNDFSETIKPLLGVSSSEYRHQQLRRTLGNNVEFEARRRQDLDLIFMIARPHKARQLVPQFKYHRSGRLAIITTSHAYSGGSDKQDIDLNNVYISDIPWAFADIAENDFAFQALTRQGEPSFKRYLRLYALGADAYRLIPDLNRLSYARDMRFNGASGLLSIDDAGYVNRQLNWGQFQDSVIQLLQTPETPIYLE